MLLHGKLESSTVSGPGNRAVLIFQGCTLNCTGCYIPDTHSFDVERIVRNDAIKTWLQSLTGVEGVTFSGGEPMQHTYDLLDLATYLREALPELSIGMYTGYTPTELETGHWHFVSPFNGRMAEGNKELWDMVSAKLDFAVMGRFMPNKIVFHKPLCTSSNQDVVLFSERYNFKDFKAVPLPEVTISNTGLVQIEGYSGAEIVKPIRGYEIEGPEATYL